MPKQLILRNYNRFLQGTVASHEWVDLYIHRFDTDFDKLVKFSSRDEAQTFLTKHPELEQNFDAWIEETERANWNGSRC